jgi:hypothetical protein
VGIENVGDGKSSEILVMARGVRVMKANDITDRMLENCFESSKVLIERDQL